MSVLRNINYMKNFAAFPCATPNPFVLLELAAEALLPSLLELITGDIGDVARQATGRQLSDRAARQAGQGGANAGRSGTSRGHGRRLSGGLGRRSPLQKYGSYTWGMRFLDFEQRLMFYYLLADLGSDFVARWTSLIYQRQGCPFHHQCYADGGFGGIYIGQGESPQILSIASTPDVIAGGYNFQILHDRGASIAFHGELEVATTHKPPKNAWLQLVENQAPFSVVASGQGGGAGPLGGTLSGGFHNIPAGKGENTGKSYTLVLKNMADDETVGVISGTGKFHISSGFCTSMAPAVPDFINQRTYIGMR